jgi:radical SAM superfamily enzyme YgiQ (UPF0313 family)
MKVLLCTLNAKYIHSSLALRYLSAACTEHFPDTIIREFTINEPLANIRAEIFEENPDILCFSCYIWNIQPSLQICADIKKVLPQTQIVLGGPEVSFQARKLMQSYPMIDYILKGEGDFTLLQLLQAISNNKSVGDVEGLVWRENNAIQESPCPAIVQDLNSIPRPYRASGDLKDRLVYYETSRGCPFNCSYCLSSTIKGVRFLDLERVKKDLSFLIDSGVKQIKFVDRTFNCREDRAIEIMKFIMAHPGETKFHFEICADLISPDMLNLLSTVPAGIFDFEIGVQSTCPEALKAVNRKTDWDKLVYNVARLKELQNIHLHLDLIAGLPYENYQRFGQSFNMVYALRPDVLQLGFLKLLKGSRIRNEADCHGYKYESNPPYQVLSNDYISYGELVRLSRMEDLLDKYFNSGDFNYTLGYICEKIYKGDAFAFYEDLADYWAARQLFKASYRKETLYSLLKDFITVHHSQYALTLNELLKFDYLANYKAYELPPGIERFNPTDSNVQLNLLLKNVEFLRQHIGEPVSHGQLRRNTILEYFRFNPLQMHPADVPIPLLFLYKPGQKKAVKIFDDVFL